MYTNEQILEERLSLKSIAMSYVMARKWNRRFSCKSSQFFPLQVQLVRWWYFFYLYLVPLMSGAPSGTRWSKRTSDIDLNLLPLNVVQLRTWVVLTFMQDFTIKDEIFISSDVIFLCSDNWIEAIHWSLSLLVEILLKFCINRTLQKRVS